MTPLLAISDTVWLALISTLGPILLAWMQWKTGQKVDAVAKVADVTHSLVNSGMGSQLQLHAATARSLANVTGAPSDIAVADAAEKMSREHSAKQAIVDQREVP